MDVCEEESVQFLLLLIYSESILLQWKLRLSTLISLYIRMIHIFSGLYPEFMQSGTTAVHTLLPVRFPHKFPQLYRQNHFQSRSSVSLLPRWQASDLF